MWTEMSSKFQPSGPHSENTELSSLHMKLRAAVATTTGERKFRENVCQHFN